MVEENIDRNPIFLSMFPEPIHFCQVIKHGYKSPKLRIQP